MRKFAVIGYPLSHTFSPKYFAEKFAKENIVDCIYEAIELKEICDLKSVISNSPELVGLNITIPYKKSVVAILDFMDEVVKKTSSCNCIKIVENKLHGYNTDVLGFEKSITRQLQPYHTNALILGTGGAASAVAYVLNKLKVDFQFVSRENHYRQNVITYKDLSKEIILKNLLIINTTPIGMFPQIEKMPEIPYHFLTPEHYLFDLIYNPIKTMFLQKGEEYGTTIKNGNEMLILQAEESWKIWN